MLRCFGGRGLSALRPSTCLLLPRVTTGSVLFSTTAVLAGKKGPARQGPVRQRPPVGQPARSSSKNRTAARPRRVASLDSGSRATTKKQRAVPKRKTAASRSAPSAPVQSKLTPRSSASRTRAPRKGPKVAAARGAVRPAAKKTPPVRKPASPEPDEPRGRVLRAEPARPPTTVPAADEEAWLDDDAHMVPVAADATDTAPATLFDTEGEAEARLAMRQLMQHYFTVSAARQRIEKQQAHLLHRGKLQPVLPSTSDSAPGTADPQSRGHVGALVDDTDTSDKDEADDEAAHPDDEPVEGGLQLEFDGDGVGSLMDDDL